MTEFRITECRYKAPLFSEESPDTQDGETQDGETQDGETQDGDEVEVDNGEDDCAVKGNCNISHAASLSVNAALATAFLALSLLCD